MNECFGTREARDHDAVAAFLLACGARPLEDSPLPGTQDKPAAMLL
jgi:hypothetical protein